MAKRSQRRRAPASCDDATGFGCSNLGFDWHDAARRARSVASKGAGYVKRGASAVNRPLVPLERKVGAKYAALGPAGKSVVAAGAWVGALLLLGKLSNRIDASTVEDYASAVADSAQKGAQNVVAIGQKVFGAAEKAALRAVAPDGAQPYIDDLLQVASQSYLSPFVLMAIVNQESAWGRALTPKNSPGGTGDFRARRLTPARQKLVAQGLLKVYPSSSDLPDNWDSPLDDDGGPVVIPADGLGYGRGFVQFDFATGPEVVRDPDFLNNVPKQLQAMVDLLLQKQRSIVSLLTSFNGRNPDAAVEIPQGASLLAATIAAYNHGEGTVAKNIENGDPLDNYGAGENNNYSNRVLKFASDFTNAFNSELARSA